MSSEATIADVLEGRARWCVLCADNADVLPTLADKSVAHVITDPPYSEHTHAKVRRGGSVHAPDRTEGVKRPVISTSVVLGFDALTDDCRITCAAQFARVVSRWALIFSDVESVSRWAAGLVTFGMEHVRTGAWVKLGATPQFTGDRPGIGFEAIEIAHPKGRKRWNGGGTHGLWAFPICSTDRAHTTQKPVDLMLELVSLFTDPDELVLDPFCGSGTTGVACLRLGRRFIGIEKDAHYASVARERLSAETRGLSLSAARAGQTSLFDILNPEIP